jgi:hypothetical protein
MEMSGQPVKVRVIILQRPLVKRLSAGLDTVEKTNVSCLLWESNRDSSVVQPIT